VEEGEGYGGKGGEERKGRAFRIWPLGWMGKGWVGVYRRLYSQG